MSTDANQNPLYQIDNFIWHIPKNRWILLPFMKKVKPPPNINEIHGLSEIMSISDTNILQLFATNSLVKLYRSKIIKAVPRIVYEHETHYIGMNIIYYLARMLF